MAMPSDEYKRDIAALQKKIEPLLNSLLLSEILMLLKSHYKTKDKADVLKKEYDEIFARESLRQQILR